MIAVRLLKARTETLQRVAELLFSPYVGLAVARHHAGPVDEHVGDGLVAVHIEKEADTAGAHGLLHTQHLGAAFRRGGAPLAVEVCAGCVAAQVTPHTAVRVHIGDDVYRGALAHRNRCR